MSYAAGTYLDLRHLNETAVPDQPPKAKSAFYTIGTRILFVNFKPSSDLLKVRVQLA